VFKKEFKLKANKNPMLLLDYRCYVEGGEVGTRYAPRLRECLANLSAMTPQEVKSHYGFPKINAGKILNKRAKGALRRAGPGRGRAGLGWAALRWAGPGRAGLGCRRWPCYQL
jgi:hypothetical protein